MKNKVMELSKKLKTCSESLSFLSNGVGIPANENFPDKKSLKSEIPIQLAIIAEQATRLAEMEPGSKIFGVELHEDDYPALMELFLSDLVQFTTQHNIDLGFNIMSFAQSRIAEHAFYHLAVSPLLPQTYKSIEQFGGRVFDIYSVPFKLRVALELKLRSITGFEMYEVIRSGEIIRESMELPFSRLLKCLQDTDCLDLPCSLSNIKNVYQWACNFCHTGEKEYLWLTMKALQIVSPLFIWKEQKKAEIKLYELWTTEGMSDAEKAARMLAFKGPLQPLYYFKEGWSVLKLQEALNKLEDDKKLAALKKNRTIETWKYHLNEVNLAEASFYYCGRTKTHY